jgi:hypothetical protein
VDRGGSTWLVDQHVQGNGGADGGPQLNHLADQFGRQVLDGRAQQPGRLINLDDVLNSQAG